MVGCPSVSGINLAHKQSRAWHKLDGAGVVSAHAVTDPDVPANGAVAANTCRKSCCYLRVAVNRATLRWRPNRHPGPVNIVQPDAAWANRGSETGPSNSDRKSTRLNSSHRCISYAV